MPYYLGKCPLGDWTLFASPVAPTKETHGQFYNYAEGPWLDGFVTWTIRRVLFKKIRTSTRSAAGITICLAASGILHPHLPSGAEGFRTQPHQ